MKAGWTLMLLGLLATLAVFAAPARPVSPDVVPWQAQFQAVAGPRWIDRAAQVQAESRFDPVAISPVGALGAAQFMPASWATWGHGDPRDPGAALPAQHRYMNWIEARVGGHLDRALAGYNWGPGNVLRVQRRVAALGLPGVDAWRRFLPVETLAYLRHNAEARAQIRAALGRRS